MRGWKSWQSNHLLITEMLQTENKANADLIVNVNGNLVHRDEAGVSPFDSSVQNGDAVWEGLRVYRGRIFRLKEHLARLRKSAAMLSYEGFPDEDLLVGEISRTLAANGMEDGVHIRLTVTRGVKYTSGLDPRINRRGCGFVILAEHKPPVYDNEKGIALITAKQRRPFANVLNQHIHSCNQLTSILAKIEANASGADDALMLDTEGNLAETNATHVFAIRGGVLMTSTTKACPEGITRSTVLEICEELGIAHEVRDIPAEELLRVEAMFVTGTMGEITPVRSLDGHEFPGDSSGLMETVSEAFREMTLRESAGVRVVGF